MKHEQVEAKTKKKTKEERTFVFFIGVFVDFFSR